MSPLDLAQRRTTRGAHTTGPVREEPGRRAHTSESSYRTRGHVARALVLGLALVVTTACGSRSSSGAALPPASAPSPAAAVPESLRNGERLYNANCASCHGARGVGTTVGPPFLSPIYRPDHHADAAFQLAVRQGVQPHHWQFGPMAPITGLDRAQVDEITRYVRWLQQQAGVF
ncbi:MAG: cytochrome c [Chloroflexi bacterium]|nr:cytochrome c [Chloroflexota bacterium]